MTEMAREKRELLDEVLAAADALKFQRIPVTPRSIARQSGRDGLVVAEALNQLRVDGLLHFRPDMYGGEYELTHEGDDRMSEIVKAWEQRQHG